MPMSDREADREAMRRWGLEGRAWHPAGEARGGVCWCVCGVTNGDTNLRRWIIYGIGVSFEDAFADAAARGH